MSESRSSRDVYFEFYIDAYVKSFRGQKATTSQHLTPVYRMTCANFSELRAKLVNTYGMHIKGKAIIPNDLNAKCQLDEDVNLMDDVQSFFLIMKNGKYYNLSDIVLTNKQLHSFSNPTVSENAKIELFIYTYSNSIANSLQWERFSKDCIQKASTDRSGGASEEHIQQIVDRLKYRWKNIFRSEEVNWRIWATVIAKMKKFEEEHVIQSPPPDQLIHLFYHSPENNTKNAMTDLKVLKDEMEQLEIQIANLSDTQKVLSKRVAAIISILKIQHEIVEEAEDAMVAEEIPEVSDMISNVPNQEDIDHTDLFREKRVKV
jgi:hypothetical protein